MSLDILVEKNYERLVGRIDRIHYVKKLVLEEYRKLNKNDVETIKELYCELNESATKRNTREYIKGIKAFMNSGAMLDEKEFKAFLNSRYRISENIELPKKSLAGLNTMAQTELIDQHIKQADLLISRLCALSKTLMDAPYDIDYWIVSLTEALKQARYDNKTACYVAPLGAIDPTTNKLG